MLEVSSRAACLGSSHAWPTSGVRIGFLLGQCVELTVLASDLA